MDIDELKEEIVHQHVLIKFYRKSQRVIEGQAAVYGYSAPPHIQVQHDELTIKIQAAQNKIDECNNKIHSLEQENDVQNKTNGEYDEQIKAIHKQIANARKRKRSLELQISQQSGIDDPDKTAEIKNIEQSIVQLQQEIDRIINIEQNDLNNVYRKSKENDIGIANASSSEEVIRYRIIGEILPIMGGDYKFYEILWEKYLKLPADWVPVTKGEYYFQRGQLYNQIYVNVEKAADIITGYCLSCELIELYYFALFILNTKQGDSFALRLKFNEILKQGDSKYRYQYHIDELTGRRDIYKFDLIK